MLDYILYLLCICAIIMSIAAQFKVNSAFNKYSSVYTRGGRASEVARRMLDSAGLYHVRIERIRGSLTDHYDPRDEVLRLSDSVYDSPSAAAVGVAAHEAGHAIQHATGYLPIKIRSALVPATGFASRFAWIAIILGTLFMAMDFLLGYYVTLAGATLFAVIALFQLVTLPCEFDASARAMKALESFGAYSSNELYASRKVLTAAALTYVASFAVTALQLIRLLLRLNNRRR